MKSQDASWSLRDEMETIIRHRVERDARGIVYRSPLFGYVQASHEGFDRLRDAAGVGHAMPSELLPGARTVMVLFLPYSPGVVETNRTSHVASRLWAQAYVEANELLGHATRTLATCLSDRGYPSLAINPTGDFDRKTLTARWSHRHAGVLTGLGQLGRNRMLITARGCAGRLSSLITTAKVESRPLSSAGCQSCYACFRACPVGALKADGTFDRSACYQWLQQAAQCHVDLPEAEVCGKCVTGPCSIR